MKVSRVVLTCKSIFLELGQVLHPHGVQRMRMDGKTVDSKVLTSIYIFLITYFLIFFLSILVVSLDGFSFETNFTAVAATLNNIGPGLSRPYQELLRLQPSVQTGPDLRHAGRTAGTFAHADPVLSQDLDEELKGAVACV